MEDASALYSDGDGQLYYKPSDEPVWIPVRGVEYAVRGKRLCPRWAWSYVGVEGVLVDGSKLVPAQLPRGKFLHPSQQLITLAPGADGSLPIQGGRDWTRRRRATTRTRRVPVTVRPPLVRK